MMAAVPPAMVRQQSASPAVLRKDPSFDLGDANVRRIVSMTPRVPTTLAEGLTETERRSEDEPVVVGTAGHSKTSQEVTTTKTEEHDETSDEAGNENGSDASPQAERAENAAEEEEDDDEKISSA